MTKIQKKVKDIAMLTLSFKNLNAEQKLSKRRI